MKTMEGQRVPDVRFRIRRNDDWDELTTKDLFEGKRTVVFGLPGAFTPTCSSSHLPRYNELAGELSRRGVDTVACVSVNDAFVMEAWQRDQGAGNVVMVPDGNGEFTEGLGMLVDKSDLGFGRRSWRYSMLVDDGVIEKMFVEPEVEGDPFEVSDAESMVAYLDGGVRSESPAIAIVTRPGCSHCARAKALLRSRDLAFEEIVLGGDVTTRTLRALSGSGQVPQVFVDGRRVGSADALETYLG